MIKNPYPGKYIAFEGMDGCGKTTQCARAFQYLSAQLSVTTGEKVIKVKEPNKEVFGGELIYSLLFKEGPIGFSDMSSTMRQIHYFWNRMVHMTEIVIPALEKGINVLTDRCHASVCLDVHQTGDLERLLAIQDYYFQTVGVLLIRPDLTIIYDLKPEIALERLEKKGRRDFFEQPGKLLQTKMAYLEFAEKFSDFCQVIDASQDEDVVFSQFTGELLHQNFPLTGWKKESEEK